MPRKINVIDLFAGPGGLGEGFSSYSCNKNEYPFEIALSVEKEPSAHSTLTLRSFYRKFRETRIPNEYYEYAKDADNVSKDELFSIYKAESEEAIEETLGRPCALGSKDDKDIFDRLSYLKDNRKGPWVVIGGPPCQAYSLSGRSRNAGIKGYSAEKDERHFLYKEYLQVLSRIKPDVFVMENVKGILSSKIGGELIFPQILEDLKDPDKATGKKSGARYHIYSLSNPQYEEDSNGQPIYKEFSDYLIKSENYGIPQKRHRVILLGVKSDYAYHPFPLEKNPESPAVSTVINSMPPLRSGLSKGADNPEQWHSVMQKIGARLINKLRKNGEKKHAAYVKEALSSSAAMQSRGDKFVSSKNMGFIQGYQGPLKSWYLDDNLGGFLNHETRGHIEKDIERYLWCSTFAKLHSDRNNPSPKSHEFPGFLAPNHKNWKSGHHADRFRVQVKDKPASTVVSHISKDGHYFIHYEPSQCRSLTVREAARIQTFPDNYFFEGNRTQQYVQVGNAVPPYLARQIADIVFSIIF